MKEQEYQLEVTRIAKDLISSWTQYDIDYVQSLRNEEDMHSFHHSIGTYIRNAYHLWTSSLLTEQFRTDRENGGDKFIEDGVDCHPFHPDQVSTDILIEVYHIVKTSGWRFNS